MNFLNSFLPIFEVLFVFCNLKATYGRGFRDEGYFSNNDYDNQETVDPKIKLALSKLSHAPQWVPDWPSYSGKLGQVSAVALDNAGQLLVFHRAGNQWDASTFTARHIYQRIGEPPIPDPTILVFNETGELVDMWGQNLFYMPHGITVDRAGNVWVTDVGLHQVFKFTPNQRQRPALTLGEKFVPGNDDSHFCKPSAIAVLSTGDFFVADGYCNHRIIKFSPEGAIILQWGKRVGVGRDPFVFDVPHALALAETEPGTDAQLCVADRERGRVACFRADNGTYVSTYSNWLIGTRLFSVAYSPVHGGRLYVVNGPYGNVPVRGYVIDFKTGRLIQTFAPEGGFSNPHDIVVTPDGVTAYVAELDPHRVCKFVDEGLRNESKLMQKPTVMVPVKPTATIGE